MRGWTLGNLLADEGEKLDGRQTVPSRHVQLHTDLGIILAWKESDRRCSAYVWNRLLSVFFLCLPIEYHSAGYINQQTKGGSNEQVGSVTIAS